MTILRTKLLGVLVATLALGFVATPEMATAKKEDKKPAHGPGLGKGATDDDDDDKDEGRAETRAEKEEEEDEKAREGEEAGGRPKSPAPAGTEHDEGSALDLLSEAPKIAADVAALAGEIEKAKSPEGAMKSLKGLDLDRELEREKKKLEKRRDELKKKVERAREAKDKARDEYRRAIRAARADRKQSIDAAKKKFPFASSKARDEWKTKRKAIFRTTAPGWKQLKALVANDRGRIEAFHDRARERKNAREKAWAEFRKAKRAAFERWEAAKTRVASLTKEWRQAKKAAKHSARGKERGKRAMGKLMLTVMHHLAARFEKELPTVVAEASESAKRENLKELLGHRLWKAFGEPIESLIRQLAAKGWSALSDGIDSLFDVIQAASTSAWFASGGIGAALRIAQFLVKTGLGLLYDFVVDLAIKGFKTVHNLLVGLVVDGLTGVDAKNAGAHARKIAQGFAASVSKSFREVGEKFKSAAGDKVNDEAEELQQAAKEAVDDAKKDKSDDRKEDDADSATESGASAG